jgi:hypothetical protein
MLEYAALVVSPRALPDGLILVFQHPVRRGQDFDRRRNPCSPSSGLPKPETTTPPKVFSFTQNRQGAWFIFSSSVTITCMGGLTLMSPT